MSTQRKPHFHKYEKMQWPNGRVFYKCMEDGCSHYLPIASLAVGRESLCWGNCGRLVIITKQDIQNEIKHPMCDFCKKERAERKEAMSEI